jgi:hypothetical protein
LRESQPPFQTVYLARVAHRGPSVMREVAWRMASYVFHGLSTPLGAYLDQSRRKQRQVQATPFRSFGIYAVWFPRGLMLRVAARQACQKMIDRWLAPDENAARSAHVAAACNELLGDAVWQPDALRQRIEDAATTANEGTPAQALTAFLANLEAQTDLAVAREEPANWAHDALKRLKEWVGGSTAPRADNTDWQKSRIHRIYANAVQKVTDEYVEFLSRPARYLFEQPGSRLALAEATYAYLFESLSQGIEAQHGLVREQRMLTEKAWQQVNEAFETCLHSGSFFLFPGMRVQKMLKTFVERIAAFSRQRQVEQSTRAVEDFYRALQGRIQDLVHDLGFCAQRLKHVEQTLLAVPPEQEQALTRGQMESADAAPESNSDEMTSSRVLHDAATVLASRIVLPAGDNDLEVAATRFLAQLEQSGGGLELDHYIQSEVLTTLGGLHHLCMTNADLPRTLNGPLLEKTAAYLDRFLEVTDVCQAELSSAKTLGVDLAAQSKVYYHLALPPIGSKKPDAQHEFLLVPDSEAGEEFANLTQQTLPHVQVVRMNDPTDLLICREQTQVALTDLQEMLDFCKTAYFQQVVSPQNTPHSRYDILDWIPLDP